MMVYSLSKIYPKTYPDPYKSTSCMFCGFVLKSTSCMFCGGLWWGVEVVCGGGVVVCGGGVVGCGGVWRWCSGKSLQVLHISFHMVPLDVSKCLITSPTSPNTKSSTCHCTSRIHTFFLPSVLQQTILN